MRPRNAANGLAASDVAALATRLRAACADAPVPLLVVRVRDLERIAWREGRAAARALERRSLRTFVTTAARTLRSDDLLAHDVDREDFVAALVSRARAGAVATPGDCRAALARLASAMECGGELEVETGWTMLASVGPDDRLVAAISSALERGARERERYAFFSTIGHELRTPLTSIRGYLETLLGEDLDAATTRRFLEIARDEALRLGRLVDGMFDVSMFDLRSGSARAESSALEDALEAAIAAVTPLAAASGARIVRLGSVAGDVAMDGDRLAQTLINVFENAIKHGRPGGVAFVSVAASDERFVDVRIDDDGPGIDPLERDDVFALGRRGASARGPGSGIGLAIVRLMLERIGGDIELGESAFGGARFTIRLPRASDTERRVAEASAAT
ncbi:MAG: HAMP domain-containing histidine kinase [Candidatus Eremiobacteraeota bacterium]|nr:HAMP domain-containing histidine kinase [Candidatus Eremiobacteraeota bacterium]